jgi:hypothetical protein
VHVFGDKLVYLIPLFERVFLVINIQRTTKKLMRGSLLPNVFSRIVCAIMD